MAFPHSLRIEDSSVCRSVANSPPAPSSGTSSSKSRRNSETSMGGAINGRISTTLLPYIAIEASGYNTSKCGDFFYWSLGILTAGLFFVVKSWFGVAVLKMRRKKCSIDEAHILLIQTQDGKQYPVQLVQKHVRVDDLRLAVLRPISIVDETVSKGLNAESSISVPSNQSTAESLKGDSDSTIVAYCFEFRSQQFVLNPWRNCFVNVEFNLEQLRCSEIWKAHSQGLGNLSIIESRRQLFGKCEVIVPLKTSWDLIVSECLHPFYVFQLCSLLLWFFDTYYYYASAVLVLSAISLFFSIRETLKNNKNLHEMAKFSCTVRVMRRSTIPETLQCYDLLQLCDSTELVPGDIFALERGMKLPCDCILLIGSALVDESMMTGESKPVYKSSLPSFGGSNKEYLGKKSDPFFCFKKHNKHVLYGGSEIRDSGYQGGYGLCLVIKSGFLSEQGRMMKTLVYPTSSSRMNFEKETWKFVSLLAIMSGVTFGITAYLGFQNDLAPITIFKRSLDTITIAVPPALPIIISVGIICAQDALKKRSGTKCLMPSRINVAGRTTVIVFDKTGTLTEDDEDLLAIVPVASIHRQASASIDSIQASLSQRFPKGIPLFHDHSQNIEPHFAPPCVSVDELMNDMVVGLATCHSLGFVDQEMIGDPLEYQMFKFTGWKLHPIKSLPPLKIDKESRDSTEHELICFNQQEGGTVDGRVEEESNLYITASFNYIVPIQNPIHSNVSFYDTTGTSIDLPPPPNAPQQLYSILKVFEFDSNLHRMSVIVQNRFTQTSKVYCKGSPERISGLCVPTSLPSDWNETLSSYTERGLRVLAIAQKDLQSTLSISDIQELRRDDVETELSFLGFLLFSNLLRPDSPTAIQELKDAGCCLYMATGDGPVTGAAVAYQAGLLPTNMTHLLSGIIENQKVVWNLKEFNGMDSMITSEQLCLDTNHKEKGTTVKSQTSSSSLLQLLEGRWLSHIGLSISGEAFQHIVNLVTNPSKDREPCHLLLDTFNVDACTYGSSSSMNASCLRWSKKNDKLSRQDISSSLKKWDKKPKTMGTLEFILRYFHIFSRMSPDDKALLVQQLQTLSNAPIVGMCGDGANDCAALKEADVGISLSSREASVAGPFNSSQKKTITVVLDVLKEGRGALTNSIQSFQFVALYAMIQLCTVTSLNIYGCNLADPQFLYMDLIVVLPLTYFLSWSKSNDKLTRQLPSQSLLAWSIILSLVGQTFLETLFQLLCLLFILPVIGSDFYKPHVIDKGNETDFLGHENTIAFLVCNIQTVMVAIILSLGTRPWKIVQKNFGFLCLSIIFGTIGIALILNEAPYMMWLRHLFHLESLPLGFRTILLLIVSLNVLSSVILEEGIVRGIFRRLELNQDKQILNRESLRHHRVDEMVCSMQF